MMITLSKSVGDSFQKWGELPTADTSHVAIFCSQLAKLVQNITAEHGIPDFISFMRAQNRFMTKRGIKKRGFRALDNGIPEKPTHRIHTLLLSFVIILKSCYKR